MIALGYDTKGGTEINATGSYCWGTKFTSSVAGLLVSISAYIKIAVEVNKKFKYAIYEGTAKRGHTVEGNTKHLF